MSLHRVILLERRLRLTRFVWKLAPLADERRREEKRSLFSDKIAHCTFVVMLYVKCIFIFIIWCVQ
jgi:hypothetical protein